jgi:NTP pyrophosphatase (non-canonical NTP hydrolase)
MDLKDVAQHVHQTAVAHGFWEPPVNKAEKIALMHSELSECLEGVRKPAQDKHCPDYTVEEVELADLVIRVLDYAHHFDLRLVGAIQEKMRYNDSRPYKHGKAF